MKKIDRLATTISCYGNLYLSDQLDIDEWIVYAYQFQNQGFQFYNSDGSLYASYLAQWLESQKKRGAQQFFLQYPDINIEEKDLNCDDKNQLTYIYRNEFSLICQFADCREIWTNCYLKTTAMSVTPDLDNTDRYSGHNYRIINYVLTKVENSVLTLPVTNWEHLKEKIIADLHSRWKNNGNDLTVCDDYYYENYSNNNGGFPWYLPVLPPDRRRIIPHSLLRGLSSLTYFYENEMHPQNDSSDYHHLSTKDCEKFYSWVDSIENWHREVLLLASQEKRWVFEGEKKQTKKSSSIIKVEAEDNIMVEQKENIQVAQEDTSNTVNSPTNKKDQNGNVFLAIVLIVVGLVGYTFYNIIRYICSGKRWLILTFLFLLYFCIKYLLTR